MKKSLYISAVFLLAFATACQKDELNDIENQIQTKRDSKQSSTLLSTTSNGDEDDDEHIDLGIVIDENSGNDDISTGDTIIVNIKEVSDGDDEADNGDDSKTTE